MVEMKIVLCYYTLFSLYQGRWTSQGRKEKNHVHTLNPLLLNKIKRKLHFFMVNLSYFTLCPYTIKTYNRPSKLKTL